MNAHSQPNVITFPQPSPDEMADEFLLADVLARQLVLSDAYQSMAEQLYRARALWIGNMCLPWGLLTDGQRDGYVQEVRALVTKARHEQ